MIHRVYSDAIAALPLGEPHLVPVLTSPDLPALLQVDQIIVLE